MKEPADDAVSTVHLGQFSRPTANEIAGELEKAGIVWWYKEPGLLSQVWEKGVRLFVDRARVDEAKVIAQRVSERRNRPATPPVTDGNGSSGST